MEARGTGPIPTPPPFRPEQQAAWLGKPVALLSRPVALCYSPDTLDETVYHVNHPMAVKIEHRFDSANLSDPGPAVLATVITRLIHSVGDQAVGDDQPYTVARHISDTLFDYQLHSGALASAPWVGGRETRPPGAEQIRARIRRLRESLSPLGMWVDGVTDEGWLVTAEPDEATRVPLYGIGGRVGDVLVAVAGPADLLGDVAITMVHPTNTAS